MDPLATRCRATTHVHGTEQYAVPTQPPRQKHFSPGVFAMLSFCCGCRAKTRSALIAAEAQLQGTTVQKQPTDLRVR